MINARKPRGTVKLVVIVAACLLMSFLAGAMLIEATKAVFLSQPEGVHTYDLIGDPLSALQRIYPPTRGPYLGV
jgi:hypothetical protein